jgi:antitoxin component YwqK of YwqJK toxin-antitoxin module
MRYILTSVVLVVLLFPSFASGETVKWGDVVERGGVHYNKFTDVPFTGKITGEFQGKLKNGKKEGPWVSHHKNGQLSSKGTFKNGWKEGPWVTYYDNGQLETKGDYKNMRFEGPWVVYHDNGQLMSKGTYKDGVKVK